MNRRSVQKVENVTMTVAARSGLTFPGSGFKSWLCSSEPKALRQGERHEHDVRVCMNHFKHCHEQVPFANELKRKIKILTGHHPRYPCLQAVWKMTNSRTSILLPRLPQYFARDSRSGRGRLLIAPFLRSTILRLHRSLNDCFVLSIPAFPRCNY